MQTHHEYSPSCLYRRVLCPGSVLYADLDTTSPYAEYGTRMHRLIDLPPERRREACPDLSSEDEKLLDMADRWARIWATGASQIESEKRLELASKGRIVYWGTPDRIYVMPPTTVEIVDWKFGWRPLNESAWSGQAAGLAALVFSNYTTCTHVVCKALHLRSGKDPSIRVFTNPTKTLRDFLALLKDLKSQRTVKRPCPEACECCPGLGQCVEAHDRLMELVQIHHEFLPEASRLEMLVDNVSVIEAWVEHLRDYIREYLNGGGQLRNAMLVDMPGRREVSDVPGLVEAWTHWAGNVNALLPAIRANIGPTEQTFIRLWRESHPADSIEDAKGAFAKSFGKFITQGQGTKKLCFR